jgi:hypothetical protein
MIAHNDFNSIAQDVDKRHYGKMTAKSTTIGSACSSFRTFSEGHPMISPFIPSSDHGLPRL